MLYVVWYNSSFGEEIDYELFCCFVVLGIDFCVVKGFESVIKDGSIWVGEDCFGGVVDVVLKVFVKIVNFVWVGYGKDKVCCE